MRRSAVRNEGSYITSSFWPERSSLPGGAGQVNALRQAQLRCYQGVTNEIDVYPRRRNRTSHTLLPVRRSPGTRNRHGWSHRRRHEQQRYDAYGGEGFGGLRRAGDANSNGDALPAERRQYHRNPARWNGSQEGDLSSGQADRQKTGDGSYQEPF